MSYGEEDTCCHGHASHPRSHAMEDTCMSYGEVDTCHASWTSVKRDLLQSKETYYSQKRPTTVRRDLLQSQETYYMGRWIPVMRVGPCYRGWRGRGMLALRAFASCLTINIPSFLPPSLPPSLPPPYFPLSLAEQQRFLERLVPLFQPF